MTTLVLIVNKVLAIGTIAGLVFIIASLLYFFWFKKMLGQNQGKVADIVAWITNHNLLLAFIMALLAMCGSLFYSQIAGYTPCELCWYQRIFMYPLVFVLGLALFKKPDKSQKHFDGPVIISPKANLVGEIHIVPYVLLLAGIGTVFSLYHNYIYYMNRGLNVFCLMGEAQVSCVKRYVFEFGFVTIPLMALTAFLVIIVLLAGFKNKN